MINYSKVLIDFPDTDMHSRKKTPKNKTLLVTSCNKLIPNLNSSFILLLIFFVGG